MKKLIVFDLDGTLAESKSSIDAEMAKLLDALLCIVKISVIPAEPGYSSRSRCLLIWLTTNV